MDSSQDTDCSGDSDGPRVLITNVASDDGEQEFKICGTDLPNPVYSVGNSIQVTLRSGAIGYPGFNLTYEAIDGGLRKLYSMTLRASLDLEIGVGRFS